jgi:hypothetical protein
MKSKSKQCRSCTTGKSGPSGSEDRKRKKKTSTATINTVPGDEWWYSNIIIVGDWHEKTVKLSHML